MSPRMITFLFLVLALFCYGVGFAYVATVFIGLGVLAELIFWVRLFRRDPGRRQHH